MRAKTSREIGGQNPHLICFLLHNLLFYIFCEPKHWPETKAPKWKSSKNIFLFHLLAVLRHTHMISCRNAFSRRKILIIKFPRKGPYFHKAQLHEVCFEMKFCGFWNSLEYRYHILLGCIHKDAPNVHLGWYAIMFFVGFFFAKKVCQNVITFCSSSSTVVATRHHSVSQSF